MRFPSPFYNRVIKISFTLAFIIVIIVKLKELIQN